MSQPVSAPDLIAFADRKTDGAFPVTAEDGRVLARITVNWAGSSFEAVDEASTVLCRGKRRSMFSRTHEAVDATGAPLLDVRDGWGNRRTVTLPGGTEWELRGRAFRRDFAVTDEHGRQVVAAQPDLSSRFLHPDGFVVQSYGGRLSFAQLVALVEINRLMIKRARGATAAAGAASGS